MSQRNDGNVKLNLFQKIRLNIQNVRLDRKIKRIKKVHKVDIQETDNIKVRENFTSKKDYRNYVKEIEKVIGRGNYRFKKTKQGGSVKTDTVAQLRVEIAKINKSYSDRRQNIVKTAREKFDPNVADMIEREMEELENKQKRTRMVKGDFADLIDLDEEKMIDSIVDEKDAIDKLKKLLENDYYDLDRRDAQYRKNYIAAIFNQYGENDDTNRLADIIREINIDDFMSGFYNPYSNTRLPDIYDMLQIDDYIEYLTDFYSRIGGLE